MFLQEGISKKLPGAPMLHSLEWYHAPNVQSFNHLVVSSDIHCPVRIYSCNHVGAMSPGLQLTQR
jgi:hypothetical protein